MSDNTKAAGEGALDHPCFSDDVISEEALLQAEQEWIAKRREDKDEDGLDDSVDWLFLEVIYEAPPSISASCRRRLPSRKPTSGRSCNGSAIYAPCPAEDTSADGL